MESNRRTTAGLAIAAAASLFLGGCGVTNTGAAGGSGGAEGPFYEGEKITLIVPFDAGGASDTYSRMLVR
jgi:tripartite-type tricarboxylate transporter receptor subunit TctC